MQPAMQVLDAVRPQIDAANRRFTERFNAGDYAGAARGVYTADARVLPPGAPLVRGREATASFWEGAAAALGITEVTLTTLELRMDGATAYEIGRADLVVAGGSQRATAKYVVVWAQEAGEWRWDVDIWNMDG